MAARTHSMEQHRNCCKAFAAAYTSARISGILDTVILAVSIIVLRLSLQILVL